MAELGREAGGVAGDGNLTGQIEAAAGHRLVWTAKPSFVQKECQNGSSSYIFRQERDADGAALTARL